MKRTIHCRLKSEKSYPESETETYKYLGIEFTENLKNNFFFQMFRSFRFLTQFNYVSRRNLLKTPRRLKITHNHADRNFRANPSHSINKKVSAGDKHVDSKTSFTHISTVTALKLCSTALLSEKLIAIDTELKNKTDDSFSIQISTADTNYVIDVEVVKSNPHLLKRVFECKNITKAFCGGRNDYKNLFEVNLRLNNVIDVQNMYKMSSFYSAFKKLCPGSKFGQFLRFSE